MVKCINCGHEIRYGYPDDSRDANLGEGWYHYRRIKLDYSYIGYRTPDCQKDPCGCVFPEPPVKFKKENKKKVK